MKKLILAAYVLLSCCVCLSFASKLETYKEHFEKKLEGIFWSNGEEIKKLNKGYETALDNLKAKAVSEGNLDLVEAVVKEKKSFARKKTVSSERINDSVEAVSKLQKMYVEARQKLKIEWAKGVLSLVKDYDEALKNLQVTFTRKEDISAARAVREERKRFETIHDVMKARAYLKKLGLEKAAGSGGEAQDESTRDISIAGPEKGLVLYYPFRVNEQGDVSDKSGNGNHGKVHSATWHNKGKAVGGCYEFDGKDDHIRKSIFMDPDKFNNGISFGAWIKVYSTPERRASTFVGWEDNGAWGGTRLYISSSGRICYRFGSGSNKSDYRRVKHVPLGKWCHVFATHDSSQDTLYFNGIRVHYRRSRELSRNSCIFQIGRILRDSKTGKPFHGLIDEVRVYNRGLSDQEVRQLYNAEK